MASADDQAAIAKDLQTGDAIDPVAAGACERAVGRGGGAGVVRWSGSASWTPTGRGWWLWCWSATSSGSPRTAFFLLTRASYALGDARRPTLVNLGVTVASIVAMVIATTVTHGLALLISFGVVQAVALTVGVLVLFVGVRRPDRPDGAGREQHWPDPSGADAPAVATALAVSLAIGWATRGHTIAAVVAAGHVGVGRLCRVARGESRAPELSFVTGAVGKLRGRGR